MFLADVLGPDVPGSADVVTQQVHALLGLQIDEGDAFSP